MKLSLEALDNKRLGKQRVEAYQIWRVVKGLSASKSWRKAPAVHAWYGYADALAVYIAINCAVWASRKSELTGKPFSNNLMQQHIETYKFGEGAKWKVLFQQNENNSADGAAATALAAAAATVAAPPSTAAAAASPAPIPVPVPPIPSCSSAAGGLMVDGIRIPWWFFDPRVHESDAAILYSKDKKYYKQFKPYYARYQAYVWPRDINPYHDEQKDALDALQRQLDEEAAIKAKKEERKKKSKKKRGSKRKSDEDDDEAEAATEAEIESTVSAPRTRRRRNNQ